MSRLVKKGKVVVGLYPLSDLILHNRCPRGISSHCLTSAGSVVF